MIEYFKIVSESVPDGSPHAVYEFLEYIADTYVGKEVYERAEENGEDNENLVIRLRRISRWKTSKFAPKMWSVYESVLHDEPKKNKYA